MKTLEQAPGHSISPSSVGTEKREGGRNRYHRLAGAGTLVLAGAGIGLGMAAYSFFVEPFSIGLERLTVRLANGGDSIPPDGLRILHLSDVHFQGKDRRELAKIERIRRLTAGMECDIIVHTGDFLHFDGGLDNVTKLLDVLPQPRLGSYAVLGNHDYTHYAMGEAFQCMWHAYQAETNRRRERRGLGLCGIPKHLFGFGRYVRNTPVEGRRTGSNDAGRLTAVLEKRGIQVLHNRSICLYPKSEGSDRTALYLCGVDDVVEGRPYIDHALDNVPPDAPTILLSHNPDILQSPRIGQVDLVLSGHTHGGQIVIPLWGPAHTQVEFLAREHVSGSFRINNTHVYITRGLGEGIPLRFGASPQLALITVTA